MCSLRYNMEWDMDALQLNQKTDELLQNGKYDEIKPLLLSYKEITEKDNDLATICYLCTIYEQEKAAGQPVIFSKISGVEDLINRYTILKFYLRRIEFDVAHDLESFYQFLAQRQVSSYELMRVIDFSVLNKNKVLAVMNGSMSVSAATDTWRTDHTEEQGIFEADVSAKMQICFIICTNDPAYADECVYYINQLIIPDGYQIDILTVEDAKSMASGYNEAMQYSKAKYKVYLHHDAFIVYPHFLQDILRIFQSDAEIGMIGVIGAPRISANGIMWDGKRYGMIYEQHIYETVMLSNPCTQPLEEVEAIDGMLMITQYDIAWREDLFDKWDFYDCSQSMEFIRHGYKVIVPKTASPWCVHDCGFLNLENYDEERKKFVAEYLNDQEDREEPV